MNIRITLNINTNINRDIHINVINHINIKIIIQRMLLKSRIGKLSGLMPQNLLIGLLHLKLL